MTAGSSPTSLRAASTIARAIGCSLADSTAPAKRRTSARVVPFSGATSTSSIRPSVTVPVLSRTTVPIRRVCSSTSGPLIRMPSCAPRPGADHERRRCRETERARTGDDQHGDGGGEGIAGVARDASQPTSVASAITRIDGNEHARDPIDEPLDRCLPGLRLCDKPRDLRQRRFRSDLRRANDEPPVRVDRRTDDL